MQGDGGAAQFRLWNLLSGLLSMERVHLGDTASSLFGEINFLHLFFTGRTLLGLVATGHGPDGEFVSFLPFQIPLLSTPPGGILLFHHAETDLAFLPLFSKAFLLAGLSTLSCLGRTNVLSILAQDLSLRSG